MPLYDGSLKFNTNIDPKGFEQGVKKLESYAKKSSLAVAAATSAISAATVKMGKDSLAAYADYEQLVGGIETLFKKSADSVIANANKAFKTAGLSANKYMETVTSFSASLLQSLDGDTQKAMQKADTTLVDMSDNANKMGADIAMIQNAYQGFAKQNYTMLDNLKLGYGGTKEEMQRLLVEAEKLSSIKYDISSFADIVDAIHVIQTEMGITGTTAREATSTIQGSFGMLEASWENLMVGLADSDQDLDKLIDDVISSAGTVMDNVVPRIETIFDSIVKVADKASPSLGNFLELLADIGGFAFGTTAKGISLVVQNIDLLTTAFVSLGAAYTTYNVVAYFSKLSVAVNAYRVAVAASTATSTAGATVEALLASSLKTAELAFGVLTGKVKLATAAHILYNNAVTFLSGPGGIALAVAGIAALGIALYNMSAEADTTSKRLKELSERSEEIKKSHEEAVASIDKNTASTMAEAETAKVLRDRLFELDEQLKDNTATEQEAELVRKELNSTANQLNQIIPDIINNIYDENGALNLQASAVDALVNSYYDLAMAKAMVNAYQGKIDSAAKSIVDEKENRKKIEAECAAASKAYVDAGIKLKNLDGKDVPNKNVAKLGIEAEMNAAMNNVDKARGQILDSDKAIESYQNQIKEWSSEMAKESEKLSTLLNPENKGSGGSGNGPKTSGGARAKQQTDEIKKEFEKQYKLLNKALEREEISHTKYYQELKALRDKYFAEGSGEWEEYTEELGDFAYDTFDDCLDKLEGFKNESLDKINELKDEQQQLKESLMPDKTSFEYGTINGEKFTSLANYDKEINQAHQYGAMLDALFEKRADIPQSVIDEIKGMDAEQATKYMEALLNSSDSQFNAFIESRKKLEEVASENSAKLMSTEMEEMKRILEKKFGELPEDFFDLDDESASAFGKAFLDELDATMDKVRSVIMSEMSAMSTEANLKLYSSMGVGSSNTTTNNYNSSYTFTSAKETITQQLATARNAATLERLRGGN